MLKKLINCIKKKLNKKILNDIGWRLYYTLRKNNYKNDKWVKLNDDKIKTIPFGAIGSVFGVNPLTQTFNSLVSGDKNKPTHTFTYMGNGKHEIAEADVYYSKNTLERYSHKKIVLHYFRDMTAEDMQELKKRVYYLLDLKLIYDIRGYAGFILRPVGLTERIKFLKASDTTVFCSDGTVLEYHGDYTHTDENIKKWHTLYYISPIADPNKNAPVHIYDFMEALHNMFPDKIGRIELTPVK